MFVRKMSQTGSSIFVAWISLYNLQGAMNGGASDKIDVKSCAGGCAGYFEILRDEVGTSARVDDNIILTFTAGISEALITGDELRSKSNRSESKGGVRRATRCWKEAK